MATVGTPAQRPDSKGLLALSRRFKQGYRLERGRGGHWRVRDDRDGRLVEYEGRPITVSGNPTGGVLKALERQLSEALVLQGTKQRQPTDEGMARRQAAARARLAELHAARQAESNALRKRFVDVLKAVGGIDTPGLAADLGYVGAYLLRTIDTDGSERLMTPDLLHGSALRLLNGAPVDLDYARVWAAVADKLEQAPDTVGEWWTLVREARGLPADTVEFRLPKGAQDDWPFRVELLPLDALLVDMTYQRPVGWPFVRREAARFDPSLVGTIDVAQRSPSSFAILDGQQRMQIVRLVGKSTIWASIYIGLDVASEARFFLHKNRDRRSVHPFYTFRALVTSGDPDAIAINAIVNQRGYKLAIGAPRAVDRQDNIAAISAVQTAYARKLPDGSDALDPTLELLSVATRGRDHGQDSMLIRGVSRVLVERPEIDRNLLRKLVAQSGPELILGRARDLRHSGVNGEAAVVRVLTLDYDKAARSSRRTKKAA